MTDGGLMTPTMYERVDVSKRSWRKRQFSIREKAYQCVNIEKAIRYNINSITKEE